MSHPKTILLVDDDQDILLVLQELLTEEGYTVQLANNGATAQSFLRQGLPDLIMLDMLISGTDGRELARVHVARHGAGRHRDDVPERRDDPVEAGADGDQDRRLGDE